MRGSFTWEASEKTPLAASRFPPHRTDFTRQASEFKLDQ
jgi:hypothetical protein